MANQNRYTSREVVEAVHGSGGLVTEIARRLNCSRMTVYRYRDRFATVRDAIQEEKEGLRDLAEAELIRQIRGGNMTAIIFYLKTQAKERGYVERQEFEHTGPITLKVVEVEDD